VGFWTTIPYQGEKTTLQAIIGDIVGLRSEFHNHRSKNFELFTEGSFVKRKIQTFEKKKMVAKTIPVSYMIPGSFDT